MFYFGCGNGAGHYLFDTNWNWAERRLPDDWPLSRFEFLDTGFLPQKMPQTEGRLHVWRTTGWAILAFWDRSVDSRPGSNSAFVMRAEDGESPVTLLRRGLSAFPAVAKRIKVQFTYNGEVIAH